MGLVMTADDEMYLNHAGTSWPKPDAVHRATAAATQSAPSEWAELFDESAKQVAEFFHVPPDRLLFTPGCTAALNIAITDLPWQDGDRLISSRFEHHALDWNLQKLESFGIEVVRVSPSGNSLLDLQQLEAELAQGSVRLVAITAACNVTGRMLPVKDVIEMAHRYDTLVLIDGAQIAGWWDLNLIELGADFFTFAGHKGLQSPHGIGGLYVAEDTPMDCASAACEIGGHRMQRSPMPGYCDVGSLNLAALAGLAAGCEWLSANERTDRLQEARRLARTFTEALRQEPNATIYHDSDFESRMPTVAFNLRGISSHDVQRHLRARGITVAAGLQCAPVAHEALGTQDTGVIRCSFGVANRMEDVETLLTALSRIG
ncbi:MAG: aminotransferase class V-fold PLP-dependent enzyme [Fuerstiella sp.]